MARDETFQQEIESALYGCGPGKTGLAAECVMDMIKEKLMQAKKDASTDEDKHAVDVVGKYFGLSLDEEDQA